MKPLSCLVIEDEPIAARIVRSYVEKIPFLKLEGISPNAYHASAFLKENKIDVIFLDIHLPKLKGIDFLKTLPHPPQVIITSAYEQYALEGYELEIKDYLLKPFAFSRFLKAVNRLDRDKNKTGAELRIAECRFFNVNKKMIRVYLDEILYVESLKEYVRIYLPEGSIVTKFQLGALDKFLDHSDFLRVHRCYLVAKNKVTSFSYDNIHIGDKIIPIGRSYTNKVKKSLGGE